MDETIPVIPQINGLHDQLSHSVVRKPEVFPQRHVSFAQSPGKKIDPDVKKMMESSSHDFNVTKLPHKKTKEESESEADAAKTVAGTSSWVIIVMAIVVILLICAIVYLVLKYNETCDPPPSPLLDNLRRKRGEVVKKPPGVNFQPQKLRPRTQPKPNTQELPPRSKGTKQELMKMLQLSNTTLKQVPEGAEHPSHPNHKETKETETPEAKVEVAEDSEKPSESDKSMISDFYQQMEMNAEDETEVMPDDDDSL